MIDLSIKGKYSEDNALFKKKKKKKDLQKDSATYYLFVGQITITNIGTDFTTSTTTYL